MVYSIPWAQNALKSPFFELVSSAKARQGVSCVSTNVTIEPIFQGTPKGLKKYFSNSKCYGNLDFGQKNANLHPEWAHCAVIVTYISQNYVFSVYDPILYN